MSQRRMIDESKLAEGCLKGDNIARKELYEQYAGQLMTICIRYVGNREEAKDLLHDGFIIIFRSFKKFTYRGEGSLRAWLARVMINESLAYLKKKNLKYSEIITDDVPDVIDDNDDYTEIPEDTLLDMISSLPDGYRMVFNLYVMEGKSHKEISDLLGITERTSSSQLYRARILLMKKIEEYRKKN